MQNSEIHLTKKQLASKRNVQKAILANANRRKSYFKKKIVQTKIDEVDIGKKSENEAQNVDIIAQQPQIYIKPVSQLTLKRRKNKMIRQMMEDEQDKYIPQKRRFIRKVKVSNTNNQRKFLSQHDKEKYVFQLRRNDINKLKNAITNSCQKLTVVSVLGCPGVGKTTSVLIAVEELGFRQQQVILVHNLKPESWQQTFLSVVGVKASQKKSKQIFQQYIKPIKYLIPIYRLFVLDEFDWMDPDMVSQILGWFKEFYQGVLIFIGCNADIMQKIGSARKYFTQELFLVQYQTQQYIKIIERLFPQLQPFRLHSMVRSFLLRSYDLRRLIQYIRINKDSVINAEIVDKNAIKNYSNQSNSYYLFMEEIKRRCRACTLTNFIIFMLQKTKSKKREVSLKRLAQAVEQHFTPNQILLKCIQLKDVGLISVQFRRRKQNEHRDWTQQDFNPTWYFKKAGIFAEIPQDEIMSNFHWTDLVPFSKSRKRIQFDNRDDIEPTTPINQSPVYSHILQQMELETQQLDQRVFSSDNDEAPQQKRLIQIVSEEEVEDRYANLTANLSSFMCVQQRKIQIGIKRIAERNKPRIPDQMPKPRHLRGIPVRQSDDEEPELNNFCGIRRMM